MRNHARSCAAALFVLAFALPAVAQPTARDLNAPPVVGRFDVGANGAVLLAPETRWLAAGPQVTINFTRQHALQLGVDMSRERTYNWSDFMGIYSIAYRYTFADRNGVRAFALAGGAGTFERNHHDAYTYTSPAYTRTLNGVTTEYPAQTREYPASTRWYKTAPIVVLGGVGVEGRLARRLILQGQVALGISPFGGAGVRAAANLSVPLGRASK